MTECKAEREALFCGSCGSSIAPETHDLRAEIDRLRAEVERLTLCERTMTDYFADASIRADDANAEVERLTEFGDPTDARAESHSPDDGVLRLRLEATN